MSVLIAIDSGIAYWHDAAGVKAYDIESGALSTVKDGAGADWLDDVENGVLAHQFDLHYRGDAGAQRIVVSSDPEATQPSFNPWSHGYLPPDAAHVAVFGATKRASSTSRPATTSRLPSPGYDLVGFGAWIDDDHFTVVGFAGTRLTTHVDLLECSIADALCTVVDQGVQGSRQRPGDLARHAARLTTQPSGLLRAGASVGSRKTCRTSANLARRRRSTSSAWRSRASPEASSSTSTRAATSSWSGASCMVKTSTTSSMPGESWMTARISRRVCSSTDCPKSIALFSRPSCNATTMRSNPMAIEAAPSQND